VSPLAQLELVQAGTQLEARISGELDLASCDTLREKLEPVLTGDGSAVLDLGGVTFIDSAGVRLLVQLALLRQRSGGLLEITPPADPWARKVLDVAQLERVVTFRA
jgi:stage II sporulation protein AA (anti-sigma F factor antagonist)